MARKYDSTVARIAGNIAAGLANRQDPPYNDDNGLVIRSVQLARYIVAETVRTEPEPTDG